MGISDFLSKSVLLSNASRYLDVVEGFVDGTGAGKRGHALRHLGKRGHALRWRQLGHLQRLSRDPDPEGTDAGTVNA